MAMTDGEVTYESGFCPAGYSPFCCAVVVSQSSFLYVGHDLCLFCNGKIINGLDTACGLPTQVMLSS